MIKTICLVVAFISNTAWAANTLVINANVITVEKDHPSAQAFAFENGRFTAVGTNEQILKLKTPSTQIIDLKGMTVTPGFNDVHLHPQAIFDESSPYYRVWLGGDRVKTIRDLIAALARKAAITPPGRLISGYGYNDVLLGRHPNRHDLDEISTTQPVIITHGSGHITAVNSFVLHEAGINKDTADPPGGALDRDPDGTPNGVIRESARELLSHGQQRPGSNQRIEMPHDQEIKAISIAFGNTLPAVSPARVLPEETRPRSARCRNFAAAGIPFASVSCLAQDRSMSSNPPELNGDWVTIDSVSRR